jgi:hypothetical protein
VASDCEGRVDRKAEEFAPRPLERARTFRSYDGASASRRLSMLVSSTDLVGGIRQRRSATVGSMGHAGNSRRTSLIYEEPAVVPAKQNREEPPRLASLVPLVARVNRFRRRPMSMYHTGPQPLTNTDALPTVKPIRADQIIGKPESDERLLGPLPQKANISISPKQENQKAASLYVDAGVQTDNPSILPPIDTSFRDYRHNRHARDSSSASSTSSIFTSYSSEISTRRSSVAEDHTFKSEYRQPNNQLPNPVMMGRMQDYFRASGYRLGDALQFGTVS